MMLSELGDLLDVVTEADDLGTQRGPLLRVEDYRREDQTFSGSALRLHQSSCAGSEDLLSFLRQRRGLHTRPHRHRGRRPEPRPAQRGGHGSRGPEARIRPLPLLLGRRGRHPGRPSSRHPCFGEGRGPAPPRHVDERRGLRPSPRSTTSRPTSRPKTSLPSSRRSTNFR